MDQQAAWNSVVYKQEQQSNSSTMPHCLGTQELMFMGPCIVNTFQYISNKMQLYTIYLYLETALNVSGSTTTHHQECIQLYLQHPVFVTPLLLPAAIVEVGIAAGSSNGVTNIKCCRYSCMRS
jgi:hypothetical protein